MIAIRCYSPKGLVVKGCTAEQAESIRAALGAAVVTSYNAKLGGWVFSRKREDRIRDLVQGMRPAKADACQRMGFDGQPCGRTDFHQHDHPARIVKPASGKPCYCGTPGVGICDFCSGLAPLDGERAKEQLAHQAAREQDTMPGEWVGAALGKVGDAAPRNNGQPA